MIETKGSCKYCGQIIMVQVPEEADQTDIDEEATMRCECRPALIYQKHKEFKEKAEIAIDTLIEDEHVNKAMKTMAAYVADRYVDSVSMASGERKYTISVGKGGPKVSVTLTRKKSIG